MNVRFVKIGITMERKSDCEHLSVLFFEEDCAFRCMKCNEKLVQLKSVNEFRLFCEFAGTDPKSLMA